MRRKARSDVISKTDDWAPRSRADCEIETRGQQSRRYSNNKNSEEESEREREREIERTGKPMRGEKKSS